MPGSTISETLNIKITHATPEPDPTPIPEDFENHSYGVKVAGQINFAPVPSTGLPLGVVVAHTETEAFPGDPIPTITYAFKLDNSLPEGEYKGEINYYISPNPAPAVTFDKAFENAGVPKDPKFGLYKMQSMTPEICSEVDSASSVLPQHTQTTTLVDVRDGTKYSVAKLKDGNCWMTSNLALELKDDKTLASDTTDLNSVASWTPSSSTLTSLANWTDDSNHPVSIINPAGAPEKAGVYYNWSAAVANNDTSSYITSDSVMPDSICPKGWKLPIGSRVRNNQFERLFTAYGWDDSTFMMPEATTLTASPLNFVLAGFVVGGELRDANGYDNLWSAVVRSNENSYTSYFKSDGYAVPSSITGREQGFSVRCVAR